MNEVVGWICCRFETNTYNEWIAGVSEACSFNLAQQLLIRNEETKLIAINFDPQVWSDVTLLRCFVRTISRSFQRKKDFQQRRCAANLRKRRLDSSEHIVHFPLTKFFDDDDVIYTGYTVLMMTMQWDCWWRQRQRNLKTETSKTKLLLSLLFSLNCIVYISWVCIICLLALAQ